MIDRETISPAVLLERAQWPCAIYSRKERAWIDREGNPSGDIMAVDKAPRFPFAVAYAITRDYIHSLELCDTVTLDLPLPPSVNRLFIEAPSRTKTGKGKTRVKTKDYKAWIEHTTWIVPNQLRLQGFPASPPVPIIRRPLGISISVNISHQGDVTNRIKALEDYLVEKKITDGDQWVNHASIERVPDLPVECRVTAYHRSWD